MLGQSALLLLHKRRPPPACERGSSWLHARRMHEQRTGAAERSCKGYSTWGIGSRILQSGDALPALERASVLVQLAGGTVNGGGLWGLAAGLQSCVVQRQLQHEWARLCVRSLLHAHLRPGDRVLPCPGDQCQRRQPPGASRDHVVTCRARTAVYVGCCLLILHCAL